MRAHHRSLFAALTLAFAMLAGTAIAQVVPAPKRFVAGQSVDDFNAFAPSEWRLVNETQSYLYQGGRCVGGYDHVVKCWRWWNHRDGWGPECAEAPVAPPVRDVSAAEKRLLNGVVTDKLSDHERYSVKGEEVSRQKVYEAIGEPKKLNDDSKKDRITFISPDKGERDAWLKDFKTNPALAALRDKALAWEAPPGEWSIENGHKAEGRQLYLQAADGTVKVRYENAIPAGQDLVGDVRKRWPEYNPASDPGPGRDGMGGLPTLKVDPVQALGGGTLLAVVLSVLAMRQNRRTPRLPL